MFGKEMAEKIERRVAQLKAATKLGDFWPPNSGPERCHELTGEKREVFSMDVKQPYRLLMKASPLKGKADYPDNQAWWNAIDSVELLKVEDTHE